MPYSALISRSPATLSVNIPVREVSMYKLLFVALFIATMTVKATEKQHQAIRLALMQVPGIMEYNAQDAPYNKLINHILKTSPVSISTQFLPYSRAEKRMRNNRIDCRFPVVWGKQKEDFPTLYSLTINQVSVYLFSYDRAIGSLDEISGQTVIYLEDYDFGYWDIEDKEKVTFVPVVNQSNALKVLQSGRASALMDYYPDIKMSIPRATFAELKFAHDSPIKSFQDTIECTDTKRNRKFIAWINQQIETLKTSGRMHQLLGEHYNTR